MDQLQSLLRYYLDCLYFESYLNVELNREAVEKGRLSNSNPIRMASNEEEYFIGYPTVRIGSTFKPLCIWPYDPVSSEIEPTETTYFHQYVFQELGIKEFSLLQAIKEKVERNPQGVFCELREEFEELVAWLELEDNEIIWEPVRFVAPRKINATWSITDEFECLVKGEHQLSPVARAYLSYDVTGIRTDDHIYHAVPSNYPQNRAIRSYGERITVIQGPPGTGKTQTILNLIVKQAIEGRNALVSSTNNTAVDNIIEKYEKEGLHERFPGYVRFGNKAAIQAALPIVSDRLERVGENKRSNSESVLQVESNKNKRHSKELFRLINEIEELEEGIAQTRLDAQSLETRVQQMRMRLPRNSRKHLQDQLQQFQGDFLRIEQLFGGILLAPQMFNQPATLFRKLLTYLLGKWWKTPFPFLKRDLMRANPDLGLFLLEQIDPQDSIHSVSELHDLLQGFTLQRDLFELESKLQASEKQLEEQRSQLSNLYSEKQDTDKRLLEIAWKSLLKRLEGDVEKQTNIRKYLQKFSDKKVMRKTAVRDFSAFQELFPIILTTNLSVRNFAPYGASFDLVIVDEASQCSILSMISLLQVAKRIVIIGDDKQLPHIPAITQEVDEKLLGKAKVPTMGAYSHRSLSAFDRALYSVQGDSYKKHLLSYHYRCAPSIIEFSNRELYFRRLVILTSDKKPNLYEAGVHFIDVSDGKSENKRNMAEVARIRELVAELQRNGIANIGVVTPFHYQAKELEKRLPSSVKVGTVHKFQGGECEAILFSSVIAPGSTDKQKRFAQGDARLINVAVTRAIKLLIVVGHAETLSGERGYLSKLVDYIRSLHAGRDAILPPVISLPKHGSKPLLHDAEHAVLQPIMSHLQGRSAKLIPKTLIKSVLNIKGVLSEELYRHYMTATFDAVVYDQESFLPLFAILIEGSMEENEMYERLCLFAGEFPLIRLNAGGNGNELQEIDQILTELRIV